MLKKLELTGNSAEQRNIPLCFEHVLNLKYILICIEVSDKIIGNLSVRNESKTIFFG
jgi:hypothetical protein